MKPSSSPIQVIRLERDRKKFLPLWRYHSFPNPLQLADGHFNCATMQELEKQSGFSGLRAIQMLPAYIFALQLFDDPRQHGQCLKKTD